MSLIPYRRNDNTIASYYNPFRMMEQMERELFGDQRSGSFSTDIRETDTAYVLEADLPGFKKEDINIDINGTTLVISAQKKTETEEKSEDGKYIRRERSTGSFKRSFDITDVDTENISAEYKNGILTIELPKQKPEEPVSKHLDIK